MAREEELKRIDLKVNVSCCEGCRRKVMKAMSLKGVLRTEIQPSHDRVTVVGDVDAKVLVKKLAKIGKIAEVLPAAAAEDGKIKRDDGGNNRKEPAEERSRGKDDGKSGAGDKAKAKAAGKQECTKCAHEAARADGGGNGDHADVKAPPTKGGAAAAAKSIEEGADAEALSAKSLAPPDRHVAPQMQMQQHYHRAEPPMAVPVHMPAYYAPPAPYNGYYGMPPPMAMPVRMAVPMPMGVPQHPQLRAQPSRFDEDFFNDDNAVGCRVM